MTSQQPENEISADAAWHQKIMHLIRGPAIPATPSPYALANPLPPQATHNLILESEPSIRYYLHQYAWDDGNFGLGNLPTASLAGKPH